jgi:hypothetical protein
LDHLAGFGLRDAGLERIARALGGEQAAARR